MAPPHARHILRLTGDVMNRSMRSKVVSCSAADAGEAMNLVRPLLPISAESAALISAKYADTLERLLPTLAAISLVVMPAQLPSIARGDALAVRLPITGRPAAQSLSCGRSSDS